MSVEIPKQPEVNLSLDANKHLGAADQTVDRRSSGLGAERKSLIRQILGKKLLVPATLALLVAAGCSNVGNREPTFTEAPSSTPAASESSAIPSATIEAGYGYTRESIKNGTEPIYNQLITDIETGVDKDKRYFVTVGEKDIYQGRLLIFTEPIESGNPREKVWIAIARDGPKSFSRRDVFAPPDLVPKNLIETLITKNMDYLRQEAKDWLPYQRAQLGESGGEIATLAIGDSDDSKWFINFKSNPPTNSMIEEAIRKSQEKAGLPSKPESGNKNNEALENAKRTYDDLEPFIKPQQPPQPPAPTP